jgi:hypothetical protein
MRIFLDIEHTENAQVRIVNGDDEIVYTHQQEIDYLKLLKKMHMNSAYNTRGYPDPFTGNWVRNNIPNYFKLKFYDSEGVETIKENESNSLKNFINRLTLDGEPYVKLNQDGEPDIKRNEDGDPIEGDENDRTY